MITELSISDSAIFELDWFKSLDRILKRAKFDNYYDLYQYNDHGYVLGPGSIRGFSFNVSANTIKFNLDSFASITDWQILYKCTQELVTEGRGLVYLNGEQSSLLNITKKDASKQYLKHMRSAIIENRTESNENKYIELRVNDFTIKLPVEKLTKKIEEDNILWENFETHLIKQIDKYGPIQHAKINILKTADADLRVANYHHLASIIPKECDYISLKGITRSLEGLIPLTSFTDILGSKIKDLAISYYVPDINLHDETEIYDSFKKIQIAMPQTITEEESTITEEESTITEEDHSKVWKKIIDEVIDLFQEGKTIGEITLSLCTNKDSDENTKVIGHATIDTFQFIAKDKSLVQNFTKLKHLLIEKEYSEKICDFVIKNVFTRMKEIAPEENKDDQIKLDDGGWLILASFIAISVLGVLFIIVNYL